MEEMAVGKPLGRYGFIRILFVSIHDSLDWKDYGVDSIIKTVCEHKNLQNGSIILMHNGAKHTHKALDTMITKLKDAGYAFVRTSELVYRENYRMDHTGRQIPKK